MEWVVCEIVDGCGPDKEERPSDVYLYAACSSNEEAITAFFIGTKAGSDMSLNFGESPIDMENFFVFTRKSDAIKFFERALALIKITEIEI